MGEGGISSEKATLAFAKVMDIFKNSGVFKGNILEDVVRKTDGLSYGSLREGIHGLLKEEFDVRFTVGDQKNPKLKISIFDPPLFLLGKDLMGKEEMYVHIGSRGTLEEEEPKWDEKKGCFRYPDGKESLCLKLKKPLTVSQVKELKMISEGIKEKRIKERV